MCRCIATQTNCCLFGNKPRFRQRRCGCRVDRRNAVGWQRPRLAPTRRSRLKLNFELCLLPYTMNLVKKYSIIIIVAAPTSHTKLVIVMLLRNGKNSIFSNYICYFNRCERPHFEDRRCVLYKIRNFLYSRHVHVGESYKS